MLTLFSSFIRPFNAFTIVNTNELNTKIQTMLSYPHANTNSTLIIQSDGAKKIIFILHSKHQNEKPARDYSKEPQNTKYIKKKKLACL